MLNAPIKLPADYRYPAWWKKPVLATDHVTLRKDGTLHGPWGAVWRADDMKADPIVFRRCVAVTVRDESGKKHDCFLSDGAELHVPKKTLDARTAPS